MAINTETLAAAMSYTKNSLVGVGAIAGKPCQIQSITSITGGNRVTFLWVDDNGDEHTSIMDVADGLGIKSVDINANNHLIITYDDDTTHDAGVVSGGGGGGGASWGNITGTLSNQTDLQTALNAKATMGEVVAYVNQTVLGGAD